MITIKEIANAAGVTPTTVSNVIHGRLNKVSPETEKRIRAILKEENYVPRFGLNALTNRGSGIIGILINTPDFAERTTYELPFYASVIGTLENLFREKGYYTMVYSSKNVEEITKMAMGWNTEGMIAVSMPEKTVDSLEKTTKKPLVSLDMDEVEDYLIQKHYGIMSMDYKGGRLMADYLLDNHTENMIYLANVKRGADLRRYWGARDVYRERRGPAARLRMVMLPRNHEDRMKIYRTLRAEAGKNAALFFSTDLNAVEAIQLFSKEGVRVPEDISVVGFDNNIYARLSSPGLTTINCDGQEKAVEAGKMLLELIQGRTVPERNKETDVYLVERGSVKKQERIWGMNRIEIKENGIYMVMEIGEDKEVKLLHFSHIPFQEETISREYERHGFRLVELSLSGYDRPEERHGIKHTVTSPGYRLKYDSHKDYVNEQGRKLEIVTFDEETNVYVTSHFQFFQGISVVRTWSVVENRGEEPQGLEYISTFNLNGLSKEGILPRDEKMKISVVHNSWQRELQWEEYTLPQLGLAHSQPDGWDRSSKAFQVTNTGNWSAKEYIPMGRVTNQETGTSLFWQIEHNGSWHWEISDQTGHLYLQLSGPSENESHWFQWLKPGESFTSVPAGVGVSGSKPEDMMEQLTLYRRRIRRPNKDNEQLAVIFNDYMNCLWADPTTEKEFPLIDAAAEIGCEYFCIDAGWYADGYWWDAVGEWLPSNKRFPGGIQEVISYIRKKGMIPGLWLELEVMGIQCPKVKELPKEAFFQRHGKKVYDRSRYQLDFRHPQVIAHVNEVIDRLVQEYGVGYIKMDYNIEPGIGTEIQADSFGAGLLAHERAYLEWLDSVFRKYPDLIIENCSSGGLRMDYAMLSRYSIQSTSDQEDYLHYATIAANAPLAVAMEQAAIWSYPRMEGDREETVFNMVNAMLLRVHQSGHMADISPDRRALVKEGLDYYKEIRQDIRQAVPFWPLGFSDFASPWSALGLRAGKKNYLAVWRRGGEETQTLPVSHLACENCTIRIAYPKDSQGECAWNKDNGTISVRMPKSPMACIIEIIS